MTYDSPDMRSEVTCPLNHHSTHDTMTDQPEARYPSKNQKNRHGGISLFCFYGSPGRFRIAVCPRQEKSCAGGENERERNGRLFVVEGRSIGYIAFSFSGRRVVSLEERMCIHPRAECGMG